MSLKKHYFSVPTIFELANEDSWDKLDKNETKFFMMRLHFMVKVREIEETLQNPDQPLHPFRGNVYTHSGRKLTPIPVQS